jgi:hypothetical protein
MAPTRTIAAASILLAALSWAPAGAAEALVAESPFAPSGASSASASQRGEAYELAGSSSQGSRTEVCIYERDHKHSQWIPVGGFVDGIRVVSYDSSKDTAVVIVSGIRKELAMRRATAGGPPAPSQPARPFAPAPAQPIAVAAEPIAPGAQPASTAAQDQREARMLVSDLLEIGAQQRKAYQEAKQREAQAAAPSQEN